MASSTTTTTNPTTPGKPILLYVTLSTSPTAKTPAIGFTHVLQPSTSLADLYTSVQSRIPDVILLPLRLLYKAYAFPPSYTSYIYARIFVLPDPARPALLHEVLNLKGEHADNTDVWQVLNEKLRGMDDEQRQLGRDKKLLLFLYAPEKSITVPQVAEQMMYYRGTLWAPLVPDGAAAGRDTEGSVDGLDLLARADQDDSTVDAEG